MLINDDVWYFNLLFTSVMEHLPSRLVFELLRRPRCEAPPKDGAEALNVQTLRLTYFIGVRTRVKNGNLKAEFL